MSSSSFGKRERDRAKRAKAEAKRQRRQGGGPGDVEADGGDEATSPPASSMSNAELLQRIADLHERFDAGELSDEAFETTKAELLAQLVID